MTYRPVVAGLLGALLAARFAGATTIEDLCPSNPTPPDPCLVTASIAVTDGSILDAGARTLIVTAGKSLDVGEGRMTVRAGTVVLEDGARLLGAAGQIEVDATGDIELRGASSIDTSNNATVANEDNCGDGGNITLDAGGSIAAHGDLLTRGFGAGDLCGGGGRITVMAAGSATFGHISSAAGPNGYFGDAYIRAGGPVTVDGAVDMTGGAWSGSDSFTVIAGGDVVTNGTINLSVTLPEEAAGPAYLSGHDVTVNGSVLARGGDDPYEAYGGFGGELDIDATGSIDIVADVVLPAAAGGGGGQMLLNAGGDIHTGSLDLHGPGRYGEGGALDINAQGAVTLGSIDLSGGNYGGYVEASAAGAVTLGNVNAVATDSAIDDPEGGYILVSSGAGITVAGNLRVKDVTSFAGLVSLEGCDVDIEAGADVATVVAQLTAHEQMTIAGSMETAAAASLRYRSGGPAPIIVGAVTPPPSIVAASLPPCGAPPVCGDGTVAPPEECDHGAANGTPGDTCNAACREFAPALRIPGGGARTVDCAAEWTTTLAPGQVTLDRAGLPRNSQVCTDDDPACDADPTPGTCRFHVWLCLGSDDARVGCPAAQVTGMEVRGPTGIKGAPARVALAGALNAVQLPVGPGEQCSGRAAIDVPVRQTVKLRTRAHLSTGKSDGDALRLKCLAP